MLSTSKMYLYRLRHSGCFKWCALISAILIAFPYVASYFISSPPEGLIIFNAFNSFIGGLLTVFTVIFTAVFISADEKRGYIKNIAVSQKRKSDIVIPRFAVMAVALALFFVFSFAVLFIVLKLMYHSETGFSADALGRIGLAFLMQLAFMAFIQMLTVITRGTSFPIALGIVCATNLIVLIVSPLNSLIRKITGASEFDLSDFFITKYMEMSDILKGNDIVHAIVLSVVYIAAAFIINALVLEKRDIR